MNKSNQIPSSNTGDPSSIFQSAIEQIEVLVNSEHSNFDLENGRIVATSQSGMNKVVNVVKSFIIPNFSSNVQKERLIKLQKIKENLLIARDIIQSYSYLIEKFTEGDGSQKMLAQRALEAINKYNIAVSNSAVESHTKTERDILLSDSDISSRQIMLPQRVSIILERAVQDDKVIQDFELESFLIRGDHSQKVKAPPIKSDYGSKDCVNLSSSTAVSRIIHDSKNIEIPSQRKLRELSDVFVGPAKPLSLPESHSKKSDQVMMDAFRMKAIRKLQENLKNHRLSDIITLIRTTPITIEQDSSGSDFILINQSLEISSESIITLKGTFKKPFKSPLMSIPILVELQILEVVNNG